MVTILGLWEVLWMEAERTERRLWKQTLQGFGYDQWAMAPVQGGTFTSPVQYPDLASMLAAYPGPKTFLIPPGRVDGSLPLCSYTHPADAIYVFGNTTENLVGHVSEFDEVVSICTPFAPEMFPSEALAIVLYDRMIKAG